MMLTMLLSQCLAHKRNLKDNDTNDAQKKQMGKIIILVRTNKVAQTKDKEYFPPCDQS